MNPENEAKILASVQRIERYLEILTKQSIRAVMAEELSAPGSEALYLATGEKTITEIAEDIKWSPASISRAWTRWHRLGIVSKDGRGYRKTFGDEVTDKAPRPERRKRAPGKSDKVSDAARELALFEVGLGA
jgi:hypothetical protein